MNPFGSELATTCPPPTISTSIPRITYSAASVTTRLGTWPTTVTRPITTPHAIPMPIPARKTTGIGMPGCVWKRSALRNADRPSTDPIERSTFRVSTTIVSPTASRAKIVVSTRMNWMFERLRKRGWIDAVTSTSSASTATIPNSRSRKMRSTTRRASALRSAVRVPALTLRLPGLASPQRRYSARSPRRDRNRRRGVLRA